MSASETPRTDVECQKYLGHSEVRVDFARQLERELAASDAAAERHRIDVHNLTEKVIPNLRDRLADAQTHIADLNRCIEDLGFGRAKTRIEHLEKELAAARARVAELESGWSACSQACARIETERDALRHDLTQARAELEREMAVLAVLEADAVLWHNIADERKKELISITAERDALRADAERYRWLRVQRDVSWVYLGSLVYIHEPYQADAAIDAARNAQRADKP